MTPLTITKKRFHQEYKMHEPKWKKLFNLSSIIISGQATANGTVMD